MEYGDAIRVEEDSSLIEFQHKLYQPSITRTCKAICAETLAHFYAANRFEFKRVPLNDYFGHVTPWLKAIGPKNCSCINSCTVFVPYLGSAANKIRELTGKRLIQDFRRSELPFALIMNDELDDGVFLRNVEQHRVPERTFQVSVLEVRLCAVEGRMS